MINHYRTLLRNLPGPVVPDGATPGEEYAPPFQPVVLPAYLAAVRTRLFGADPDPFMVRYRLRQLLAVVHAGPLLAYVTALDPRLTYGTTAADLADPALYAPTVHQLGGGAADVLTVFGAPAAPDASGRTTLAYRIEPTGSGAVRVALEQPPFTTTATPFQPGDAVPLPGAGYAFRLTTDNPGASWSVTVVNRPQRDPGGLTADLGTLGEPALRQLFGTAPAGVYKPLAALWAAPIDTPLRLGALVTAAVYRTEERRTRG